MTKAKVLDQNHALTIELEKVKGELKLIEEEKKKIAESNKSCTILDTYFYNDLRTKADSVFQLQIDLQKSNDLFIKATQLALE